MSNNKKKQLLDWFRWGKNFVEKNKLTKDEIDKIFERIRNKMITSNPNIRFGKYCIEGTRISVNDIMALYRNGMTTEEIQKEYPQLTKEQIIEVIKFKLSRF